MSYTFESIGTEEGVEYVNVLDASGETVAYMLPRAQAEMEFVAGSQLSILTRHSVSKAAVETMLDVIAHAMNADARLVKGDETGLIIEIALPAGSYSDVQVWDALVDSGHIVVVDEIIAA